MKRCIRLFKVLGIADINIIVNMGYELVTFWNTHVKLYNCQIKKTSISYLKTANDLAKISINKPTNEEISTPLNYLESQKPRQCE